MKTMLVLALVTFACFVADTAEAACRDTRQNCEQACRRLRGDINRVEGQLNGVTGNGGWAGSTRSSAELAREEAAACGDPARRTRVQGGGTYGAQSGYRTGFNCDSRSAQQLHQRNLQQTRALRRELQTLQARAEELDCLDEIPLIERLLHALT